MTELQIETLTHLLKGGSIENEVGLFNNASIRVEHLEHGHRLLSLGDLDNYHIYLTEDQRTILKLQNDIANLTDSLMTLKKQKKKLGEDLREVNGSGSSMSTAGAYRKHLNEDEIKEVEEVFKRDFSTPNHTIEKAYGLSQTVCSHIKRGKHGKSSEAYRTHLRNIGQLND